MGVYESKENSESDGDAEATNIKDKLTDDKNNNKYKNTINLIYEKSDDEDSNNNIFGPKFVENNKENLQLKINDISTEFK